MSETMKTRKSILRAGKEKITRPFRKLAHAPAWAYLKRDERAWVGFAIVAIVVGTAIFASFIAPYEENEHIIFEKPYARAPSSSFVLGTDTIGRDVFSRVVLGSQTALLVGILLVSLEGSVGVFLGLIAGYYGGKVDGIIMRLVDVALSFPGLVLAAAFVGFFGVGLWKVIIALSLTGWAGFARITRGQVLARKEEVYVESARAIGEKDRTIIFRYIFPNCISPIIVLATMTMAAAIILSTSMSFLGLGVQVPHADWGWMLQDARDFVTDGIWWAAVFPGLAIMITVLGFNFLGDALRDALDPRLREYKYV